MKVKIYRVPASHPSQAVIRAAQLKGIDYEVVDWLPTTQPLFATLMFGGRTVPAMKILGGPNGTEKAQTTLKCLRALESIEPEPALYPSDAGPRERVLAAESWGVDKLQDPARRIAWVALRNRPEALFSFTGDAKLPLPESVLKPFSKPTVWIERKMNSASFDKVRGDLELLPKLIDEVDDYIAAGVIGGAQPNAADLTILSSIWLLRSFDDLRPFLDSRPTGRKAQELFGEPAGHVEAGAFDAAWLTEVNAARGEAVGA